VLLECISKLLLFGRGVLLLPVVNVVVQGGPEQVYIDDGCRFITRQSLPGSFVERK
jgi:hypothetical protein